MDARAGMQTCGIAQTALLVMLIPRVFGNTISKGNIVAHVHDPQLETVFTKKQADPSLLDERLLFDVLLKGAGTPFELLDSDFNIIRVNEAYAATHDQPEAFFRGKNHFDIYPSDSRSVFEKVLATGEPAQIAARPRNLPGRSEPETSYWDCTLAPIVNPHNQMKGCKLVFYFKKSGQDMQGKSITYAHKQTRYDILAYAVKKHFDTEDQVFFEPIAKSITFNT